MEMRFIALTVLITSIVVAHSPLRVDSSPPIPTIPSSQPPPPPRPVARSEPDRETNGGNSWLSSRPPPSPKLKKKRYTHHQGARNRPIKRAPSREINLGKKIGLLFAGMGVVLQVAVVGFLGFRRWQISNFKGSAPDSPA